MAIANALGSQLDDSSSSSSTLSSGWSLSLRTASFIITITIVITITIIKCELSLWNIRDQQLLFTHFCSTICEFTQAKAWQTKYAQQQTFPANIFFSEHKTDNRIFNCKQRYHI
ncbi:hypothetical protein BsWGS_19600 [Bradybaena similaris]